MPVIFTTWNDEKQFSTFSYIPVEDMQANLTNKDILFLAGKSENIRRISTIFSETWFLSISGLEDPFLKLFRVFLLYLTLVDYSLYFFTLYTTFFSSFT